jgi:hypothetical protein
MDARIRTLRIGVIPKHGVRVEINESACAAVEAAVRPLHSFLADHDAAAVLLRSLIWHAAR